MAKTELAYMHRALQLCDLEQVCFKNDRCFLTVLLRPMRGTDAYLCSKLLLQKQKLLIFLTDVCN